VAASTNFLYFQELNDDSQCNFRPCGLRAGDFRKG